MTWDPQDFEAPLSVVVVCSILIFGNDLAGPLDWDFVAKLLR